MAKGATRAIPPRGAAEAADELLTLRALERRTARAELDFSVDKDPG